MASFSFGEDEFHRGAVRLVATLQDIVTAEAEAEALAENESLQALAAAKKQSRRQAELIEWTLQHRQHSHGEECRFLVHPPIPEPGFCSHFESCDQSSPQGETNFVASNEYRSRSSCSLLGGQDDREEQEEEENALIDSSLQEDPDVVILPTPTTSTARDESTTNRMMAAANAVHETEWRFSIVWSATWQVPVLYFDVVSKSHHSSTRNRKHVLNILERFLVRGSMDSTSSWDFVSQEEHPVTGKPSFFLHPCRTKERLGALFSPFQQSQDDHAAGSEIPTSISASCVGDEYYSNLDFNSSEDDNLAALKLFGWMSMIFPAVGCPISSRAFLRVQRQLSVVKKKL